MSCKVYRAEEISNSHISSGMIFNCEGHVFVYDKEIGNIKDHNGKEVKLREYRDKLFFNSCWYRGGSTCRDCEDRICGLSPEFFVYSLGE